MLTKIKGQNFRTFVAGSPVTEAVNCQVTIQGNMEDASTKDTDNVWQQEDMTSQSWQVNVEGLDASVASLRALITRFNSDSPVSVGFDQTEGSQNRVASNADFARSGSAHLVDLSIQANNRSNANVSAQYQGTGALG